MVFYGIERILIVIINIIWSVCNLGLCILYRVYKGIIYIFKLWYGFYQFILQSQIWG